MAGYESSFPNNVARNEEARILATETRRIPLQSAECQSLSRASILNISVPVYEVVSIFAYHYYTNATPGSAVHTPPLFLSWIIPFRLLQPGAQCHVSNGRWIFVVIAVGHFPSDMYSHLFGEIAQSAQLD